MFPYVKLEVQAYYCEKFRLKLSVDFVTSLSLNFNEVWMLCCYLICRIEQRVCADIIVDLVGRRIVIQMTSSYGGNIIYVGKHRPSKMHRNENSLSRHAGACVSFLYSHITAH